LLKIAEQLKLLKERQEARLPETERVHREALQKKQWADALLLSLLRQAEAQQAIGEDTMGLADNKLKDAEVFAHILRKAAKTMEHAAASIRQRVDKAKERPPEAKLDMAVEEEAYQKTLKLQRDAVAYLEQLLAVLKPEEGGPRGNQAGGGGEGGGGGSKAESDGIPAVAQLKLLKQLQEDVSKRTEDFARKHPELKKLTDAQKQELAT